jgi:hypothetical protein
MSTYTGTKGQVSGIGAVISIGEVTGTSGTETFTTIGEVTDVKFTGRKRDTVDVTSFGSGGVKRKLGTILDYGSATLTTIRVPGDAGQLAVIAANVAGVAYDFKIQLPVDTEAGQSTTGDLITASGIVTESNFDISLTKASEFTFTIEWDGAYTVTAGS